MAHAAWTAEWRRGHAAYVLTLAAMAYSIAGAVSPPNIIVILADDQGYNDLGVFGSGKIKTPRLDRMAAEGARFTDFYVAANVCSPSRAALLTGSAPQRVGITAVLHPTSVVGLNPNEVTLADLLKRKSYATACVGKWHLGHHAKFLPTRQGFDRFFGLPYSNDMALDKANAQFDDRALFREGWTREKIAAADSLPRRNPPLMRGEKIIEFPADQATLTQRYTDESMRFIAEQAKAARPFFLYLAHSMPHIPLYPSPGFAGKSARGPYGDVIEEIDFHTGRLLDTLKDLGIDRNTLVIYTSDNGPWLTQGADGGSAAPLRDGKTTTWEGGQRVPALMWWPGRIPAGMVRDDVVSTLDLLPTVAKLAGIPFPNGEMVGGKPVVLDGRDILDVMTGKPGAVREGPFYYGLNAARLGDWKLREGALYNLKADIHEDADVSAANPASAAEKAELEGLLAAYKRSLVNRGAGTADTPEPRAGCTNPEALNYDAGAGRDDLTCRFSPSKTVSESPRRSDIRITAIAGGGCVIDLDRPGRVRLYAQDGRLVWSGSRNNVARHTLPNPGAGPYFLKVERHGAMEIHRIMIGFHPQGRGI